MLKTLLPLTFLLALLIPAAAVPEISEFMAVNGDTLADEDGEFSDWIEIYNPDPSNPLLIGGYHLTDDDTDLTKWTFPAGLSIPADSHLVVFASSKDRATLGAELHTNFKLSSVGEYLGLVAPNGVSIIQEFYFPAQSSNVSFGTAEQSIEVNLTESSAPSILVPATSGELAGTWATAGYVPSPSWTAGTAPTAVGYDTTSAPVPLTNVALSGTAAQSSSIRASAAS